MKKYKVEVLKIAQQIYNNYYDESLTIEQNIEKHLK